MCAGHSFLKRYALKMRFSICLIALLLCACAPTSGLNLGFYPDPEASPEKFIVCHGYGCSERSYAELTSKQWKSIERIFRKTSKTAEEERVKISKAIAKIEGYVGNLVGLEDDQPKAPIIKSSNHELDCVDETVNTTKYLNFLQNEGLLKFHRVGQPAYKGFLIDGTYPHNTTTILENETGKAYVVDSYISANGKEPVIRSLEEWLKTKTLQNEDIIAYNLYFS